MIHETRKIVPVGVLVDKRSAIDIKLIHCLESSVYLLKERLVRIKLHYVEGLLMGLRNL